MTYLSFESYISKARESSGTIRVAKGTENELVNKGTFGNRLATFFTSIGRAIGSVFGHQPDQTKAGRNERALEGFREALREQFGQGIANEALLRAGLQEGETRLTGKKVIEVAEISKQLVRENREINRERLTECLPPNYEDFTGGAIWEWACQKLDVDSNPFKTLTPARLEAYEERLERAIRFHSDFGKKALTEQETERIATRILKQVLKLDGTEGDLQRAQEARHNLREAVIDLIMDIGGNRSPRKVFESLLAVQHRLDELLQAEKLGQAGAEEIDAFRGEAMYEAMFDLKAFDPWTLGQARDRMVDTGSVVRGLYSAMTEFTQEGSGHQQRDANLLRGLLSTLVYSFATLASPRTESRGGDSGLLDEGDLKPGTLEKARRGIAPHFEGRVTDRSGALEFLQFIATKDGAFKQGPQVLIELERALDRHGAVREVSFEQSCEDFRATIDSDPDLPPELKEKLKGGLRALESERRLGDLVKTTPELRNLGPHDIWRLMVAGENHGNPNGSPWDLEGGEPGARARIQDTLRTALTNRTTALSVDYLERLYKSGQRPGLPEMTLEAKEKAAGILSDYAEQIGNAVGDDQKLRVIAQTIRALLDANLLETDNTRTIVFGLMNRMLLDNQLDLCILEDPDDTPRQNDFVGQIRNGQERFKQLVDPGRAFLRRIEEGVSGLRDDEETEPRWTEIELRTLVLRMVGHCIQSEGVTVAEAAAIIRRAVEDDPGLNTTARGQLRALLDYAGNPGRFMLSELTDRYIIIDRGGEQLWDEGVALQQEVKERVSRLVGEGLSRKEVCDALEAMVTGAFHAPIIQGARNDILEALTVARQEQQ